MLDVILEVWNLITDNFESILFWFLFAGVIGELFWFGKRLMEKEKESGKE